MRRQRGWFLSHFGFEMGNVLHCDLELVTLFSSCETNFSLCAPSRLFTQLEGIDG